MSVLQKWGLGAELTFDASKAERGMAKASRGTSNLRRGFDELKEAGGELGSSLGVLALSLTPLAIAYNFMLGKSSQLAADLEAQKLTMSTLLGDSTKADSLIASIRDKAASTPFQEGDLIEGSKRLLRLSKDNVEANQELLDIAMTMAALNPEKSITDAVEGILDAAAGGGFERLKEFGLAFRAEDFKDLGRPGGEAWAQGVTEAIGAEMDRITKGQDLVGALSRTFGGQLSTLRDNVTQILTGIGEELNAVIGPAIEGLTGFVKRMKGPIIQGFGIFFRGVARLAERLWPIIDRLGQTIFDRLGGDGLVAASAFAAALGALASVFVTVVGAAGGLGAVVGALVTGISAVSIPALQAAGVLLVSIAGAMLNAGAAASVLFGVVRREGEGPFDTLVRIGKVVAFGLVNGFQRARTIIRAVAAGFQAGFGPVSGTLDRMAAPLQRIYTHLQQVFGYIFQNSNLTAGFFSNLAYVVGSVLGWGFERAADLAILFFNALELVLQILSPLVLAMAPVWHALQGLIAGTGTWGELWTAVWTGVLKVVASVAVGVMTAIVGMLEFAARAIENFLSAIPGLDKVVQRVDVSGGLAGFRGDLSSELSNAVAGVDLAEAQRDREKAREQEINVKTESFFEGSFDVKTCIDGEEIGRSQGDLAVRNGEKGSGPRLPADQRGRVLRRGLEVTPLSPAEVL